MVWAQLVPPGNMTPKSLRKPGGASVTLCIACAGWALRVAEHRAGPGCRIDWCLQFCCQPRYCPMLQTGIKLIFSTSPGSWPPCAITIPHLLEILTGQLKGSSFSMELLNVLPLRGTCCPFSRQLNSELLSSFELCSCCNSGCLCV